MIKKHLHDHNKLGKLHGSYLISTDDLERSLLEVESFVKYDLFSSRDSEINSDYHCIKRKDRKTKNITVDQIRYLQSFLYKTSVITGYKVGVIYGADEMNINASNSCLKILEEPPVKTHLFLITNNAASILPTIRSRCAKISYNYHSQGVASIRDNLIKACLKDQKVKDRIEFINKFAAKDRDIWIDFTKDVENALIKFSKQSVGLSVDLSESEVSLYSQLKSQSPIYIQQKYQEIKRVIDNVNKYDLDLRSNVVLLLDKLRY